MDDTYLRVHELNAYGPNPKFQPLSVFQLFGWFNSAKSFFSTPNEEYHFNI